MKYLAAIALTFTIISSPAVADDDPQLLDAEKITMILGPVLGAETACGLEYDVDVIKNFITKNVDASNTWFPDLLQTATSAWEITTKEMSPKHLVIHCTQIRRIAKHCGFTK